MPAHNDAPMLWRRCAMAYSTNRIAAGCAHLAVVDPLRPAVLAVLPDGAATDVDPLAHLAKARGGRLVRKGATAATNQWQ
jgi:hypothetical protein